jgi:CheY-like chemotaxis protein
MNPAGILLVDDDEDYLDIARRALRKDDLEGEVHMAHTGAEALELLGASGESAAPGLRFVAAFIDLNMPGLDGWEVLRRIRADARLHWLPVIVISSSARTEDIQHSYELGANSYLVKRYETESMAADLAGAVRYWLYSNRPAARASWMMT